MIRARFLEPIVLGTCGVLAVWSGVYAQAPQEKQISNGLLEDAYRTHNRSVRGILPTYSDLPAVLDLTNRKIDDGVCCKGQHAKWEARFTGIMGIRIIEDPKVNTIAEATFTSLTTTDGAGYVYALPANQCTTVGIVRPTSATVCISRDRRYVYTLLNLQLLHTFKESKTQRMSGQRELVAAQFGGSIISPSGHLTSFLLDKAGFLGVGEQYLVFLWQPVKSDDMYVIVQAYLIRDGLVFPVSMSASNAFHYTKTPLKSFESKVEAAVATNIDTDE